MLKIYNHVDESGQDTKGEFFVVANIISTTDRNTLETLLLSIEAKSGRGSRKWHGSKHPRHQKYLDLLIGSGQFKDKIFYRIYAEGYCYLERTAYVIADSLDKFTNLNGIKEFQSVVVVDGAKPVEQRRIAQVIRRRRIYVEKVRGARDESRTKSRQMTDSLDIPYGTRVALGELPPKGWPGEPSSCERHPVRAVFGRSFDQFIYSNLDVVLSRGCRVP